MWSLTETKINDTDLKESWENPVTLQRVISAIEHLKLNKSPGTDGITSEFYKIFLNSLHSSSLVFP